MNPDSRRTGLPGWRDPRLTILAIPALLGLILAGPLRDRLREAELDRATLGAARLALEGVLAFDQHADHDALMEIPVGADSMVMAARVSAEAGSHGTWAVRVAHVSPENFQLKATGRVVAGRTSVLCSVEVALRMNDGGVTRPPGGVTDEPLCNGSPYRSAVNLVRTIGS